VNLSVEVSVCFYVVLSHVGERADCANEDDTEEQAHTHTHTHKHTHKAAHLIRSSETRI